jgi:hypothetical protein
VRLKLEILASGREEPHCQFSLTGNEVETDQAKVGPINASSRRVCGRLARSIAEANTNFFYRCQ